MLRKESIIHVLTIQTYNHKYPQTTTSQMTIRKTKKLIIQENYNFANYYDTTNKTHKNVIFRSNKAFSISNNIKIAEIQKSTSLSEYISTKIWTHKTNAKTNDHRNIKQKFINHKLTKSYNNNKIILYTCVQISYPDSYFERIKSNTITIKKTKNITIEETITTNANITEIFKSEKYLHRIQRVFIKNQQNLTKI